VDQELKNQYPLTSDGNSAFTVLAAVLPFSCFAAGSSSFFSQLAGKFSKKENFQFSINLAAS